MQDNQTIDTGIQAPVSDSGLSDQFPTDISAGSQPTTAQEGQSSAPEVSAQPTSLPFELRTSTGTIYKSPEEAQRGIEHKDILIQQLRQQFVQQVGYDPLNQQQQPQQFQQQAAPQATGYAANPKQYAMDLNAAAQYGAQTGDYSRYYSVQQQAIDERAALQIEQYLAPYQGIIQGMVKNQAFESASTAAPDFRKFYGSQDYQKVLSQQPLLADAIQTAEQNPQYADKLPGLYQLTFQLNQAAKIAETVRAQSQAPVTPSPQQTPRPTATTSTMTPNAPSAGAANNENWRSDGEARKQLIAAMEAKFGIRPTR